MLVPSDIPDPLLRSRVFALPSLLLKDLLIWLMIYRASPGPGALHPPEAAGLCPPEGARAGLEGCALPLWL